MQGIFTEYQEVKESNIDSENSLLSNAPHTSHFALSDDLDIPYSRIRACHPDSETDQSAKYWPPVGRIDNVYGDKNLICSCPSMSEYE